MFATLFSSAKFYVVAAVIAVTVAAVGYFGVKYQSALGRVAELEQVKITLENANAKLEEVNKNNEKFISDMKSDAKTKEKLVNDFRIQKARDDKQLDELRKKIQAVSAEDDGPVAKVLRDAMSGVSVKGDTK
mgnify:FL=1